MKLAAALSFLSAYIKYSFYAQRYCVRFIYMLDIRIIPLFQIKYII